jgi:hypothetical protein
MLVEQVGLKQTVNREFHYVMGLEKKEEDPVDHQVAQLAKAIQQLQQRITYLEIQTIPSTP